MVYERTQRSPMWLIAAAPVLAGVGVFAVAVGADPLATIFASLVAILFIALIANFSALTVTVEPDRARASFGLGWPRKTVDLGSVLSVHPVRNHWFYGLGIRWIPKGSLWNVWGLDAVEFRLDNGRVVRFGTDDRDGLVAVLTGLIGG